MKKQICILLSILMLCSSFILPVSAYTVVDYSSYEGRWDWDQGGSWMDIYSCTSTAMSFEFVYGQFAVTVTNAQVDGTNVYGEYYEVWDDALWDNYVISGNFKMSLGDNGTIWLDWTSSENGSTPSTRGMLFYNPSFTLRTTTIEEDNITVTVNGVPLTFDQQPVMANDRVMVPMRGVFEALGADVYWDDKPFKGNTGQMITAIKGDTKVVLWEYDGVWGMDKGAVATPRKNLTSVNIYTQPIVVSDRTLVPIRAVSEAFDAHVEWDADNNRVHITGDVSEQRRSEEEVIRIQNFSYSDAKSVLERQFYFLKGTATPDYDANGKFYPFTVSSDGTSNGKEIAVRVYDSGKIIEQ